MHCQQLILDLLTEKTQRLSSYKYKKQDKINDEHHRRYVFDVDDAIEIKSHHWFRGIDWQNLQNMTPGFTPHLRDAGDTRYFEEDEPISDWSESEDAGKPFVPHEEIRRVLKRDGFGSETIRTFLGMIERPYDAIKLRNIDIKIESNGRLSDGGKDLLKFYAREFGCKERKRPRDILLRDKTTQAEVMDIRKQTAFLDYTWLKAPSPPRVPTLLEGALDRAHTNMALDFDLLPPQHALPLPDPASLFHQESSYGMYRPNSEVRRYWHGDGHYDYDYNYVPGGCPWYGYQQ